MNVDILVEFFVSVLRELNVRIMIIYADLNIVLIG